MTTPLTSISLPTFGALLVSAIRFLERRAGQPAPSTEAPASVQESTEGAGSAIHPREVLGSLHERRHTGVVVELSDVRRDEGWDHALTVPQHPRALRGSGILKARTARNPARGPQGLEGDPAPERDVDGPAHLLERGLAKCGGERGGVGSEGAAALAAAEVVAQQDRLELGQLAVELSRNPRAHAIAFLRTFSHHH